MNQFETQLEAFDQEAEKLQKEELKLKVEEELLSKKEPNVSEEELIALVTRQLRARKNANLFAQKWLGFLRNEVNLPEDFTMPRLVKLAVHKSKESKIELIK